MLGEVEDALQCFNKCLESGPGVCLDRKFIIEAADGLQKAQVPHFFPVILVTQYCWVTIPHLKKNVDINYTHIC